MLIDFTYKNNRSFYICQRRYYRFDFTRFDTLTIKFYLAVFSTAEYNLTVLSPVCKVTCSVKPAFTERIVNELFCR